MVPAFTCHKMQAFNATDKQGNWKQMTNGCVCLSGGQNIRLMWYFVWSEALLWDKTPTGCHQPAALPIYRSVTARWGNCKTFTLCSRRDLLCLSSHISNLITGWLTEYLKRRKARFTMRLLHLGILINIIDTHYPRSRWCRTPCLEPFTTLNVQETGSWPVIQNSYCGQNPIVGQNKCVVVCDTEWAAMCH